VTRLRPAANDALDGVFDAPLDVSRVRAWLRRAVVSVADRIPFGHELAQLAYFSWFRSGVPRSFAGQAARERRILEDVSSRGFSVVPDYVSQGFCERAVAGIERCFEQYPHALHRADDVRLFGIEHVLEEARVFHDDPLLLSLANLYTSEENVVFLTLGNRVRADGPYGSGGDWHRDGFLPEIKALLYLNDVDEENGAFEIIEYSHLRRQILRDTRTGRLKVLQNRVDRQADEIVRKDPGRLHRITAAAGTLVVFDDAAIHRGAPLRSGCRYALTNYIFRRSITGEVLRRSYAPFLLEDATVFPRASAPPPRGEGGRPCERTPGRLLNRP
jgi:hypothetical protein